MPRGKHLAGFVLGERSMDSSSRDGEQELEETGSVRDVGELLLVTRRGSSEITSWTSVVYADLGAGTSMSLSSTVLTSK